MDALDEGFCAALRTAEQAFTRLENAVERILVQLVLQICACAHPDQIVIRRRNRNRNAAHSSSRLKREQEMVLRYFVFLQYHNSEAYKDIIGWLTRRVVVAGRGDDHSGTTCMALCSATCFASLDEDFGGDSWVVIRFSFPNDHTFVNITSLPSLFSHICV